MRKEILIGAAVFAAAFAVWDGYFIVNPTEMAGKRRLGTVASTQPYAPGLHLKVPLIETVDYLQTSIDSFKVEGLQVYIVDNQAVTIDIGVTYQIPESAVLKLLYHVGGTGSVDIHRNMQQIIADRALRSFAKRNTTKISEEREQIAADIRSVTAAAVKDLFGIEIIDFQIPAIRYSDTFVASVETAVKAKNDAIAAENTVNRIRYEGEQRVVTAKATAEATVTHAQAEKLAIILAAEGEARKIELETSAEAKGMAVKGAALAQAPGLTSYVYATRWGGQPPHTVMGSNAGVVPFFSVNTAEK